MEFDFKRSTVVTHVATSDDQSAYIFSTLAWGRVTVPKGKVRVQRIAAIGENTAQILLDVENPGYGTTPEEILAAESEVAIRELFEQNRIDFPGLTL